jgi:poly-gamma-glutamate system protein
LGIVESFPVQKKQAFYEQKLAAARLARLGMRAIRDAKQKRGLAIDREADPAETGMIGAAISPITANTGFLDAKRTSANPNFAAVLVEMLGKAGLPQGSAVAVGVSGSFPALNLAAFAALHEMGLKPIVISRVSASEWGANQVEYTWLDMERTLVEKKLTDFRSVAASRGGIDDRGFGITKRGRTLLDEAIARAGVTHISAVSLADAIDKRMEVYDEAAAGRPIRAYINVGGGSASVGTHVGKKQVKPGLNLRPPRGQKLVDSVMRRFLEREVPVIHITGINRLARIYGLPVEPTHTPPIGQGGVYSAAEYNRWLTGAALLMVLAVMLIFIRWDVGLRILSRSRDNRKPHQPEQMI